jgi:osmotically-inducible protein OsmY
VKPIPFFFSDRFRLFFFASLIFSLLIPLSAGARSMSDQELLVAVETRLEKDPGVSEQLVDVKVRDGVVTLSGATHNALGADRATRVAENIRGVRSVVNTIEVQTPDRPAEEIAADVTAALKRCPAPNVQAIEVSAADGLATLEGAVNSWREKRLAEQKAKSIRGVKGVENNLEIVYDAERTDADIRKDIETALQWDAWLHGADLDVAVNDGKVELLGSVASALQRRRAQADARVKGVAEVSVKGVTVASEGTDSVPLSKPLPDADDEAVAKAVRRAFSLDPRIDGEKIEIFAKDGVVTLDGRVRQAGTRRALAETARATRGVWMVRNNVGIKPGMISTRDPMVEDDPRIARRARTALLANADVHQHEIGVEVTSGVAELTGKVDSDHQKQVAEQVVSEVRGVVRVANRIDVAAEETPRKSDPAIREDIRDELFWTHFVDGEDVTVTVRGGVATLTGAVDTLEARRAATKNARDGGAVEVRNRLRVRVGPAYYQP